MGKILDIRTALKTKMATISGLNTSVYIRDMANVPIAMVGGPEVDFDKTFGRGSDDYEFPIMVFSSKVSDEEGQARLDSYLDPSGPKSIKAAIEADGTLGGVVDFAWVSETREYAPHDINGVTYLGAVLIVKITVSA